MANRIFSYKHQTVWIKLIGNHHPHFNLYNCFNVVQHLSIST